MQYREGNWEACSGALRDLGIKDERAARLLGAILADAIENGGTIAIATRAPNGKPCSVVLSTPPTTGDEREEYAAEIATQISAKRTH